MHAFSVLFLKAPPPNNHSEALQHFQFIDQETEAQTEEQGHPKYQPASGGNLDSNPGLLNPNSGKQPWRLL